MRIWRIEAFGRELFKIEVFDDEEEYDEETEDEEEDEDSTVYAHLTTAIPCESCGEMFEPDEDFPPLSWGQRLVWDIDTPTEHPLD
jgi:hypothetical protein